MRIHTIVLWRVKMAWLLKSFKVKKSTVCRYIHKFNMYLAKNYMYSCKYAHEVLSSRYPTYLGPWSLDFGLQCIFEKAWLHAVIPFTTLGAVLYDMQ